MQGQQAPALVVFSGGTAFNTAATLLRDKVTTRVSHVLPVSDDGGSTAEIVRVLGGPAVGDIRSRCLRLSDASTAEARAVKTLLGHRLRRDDDELAKREWYEILELESPLWEGVSEPYKQTIKAFLVQFQTQLLRHNDGGGGGGSRSSAAMPLSTSSFSSSSSSSSFGATTTGAAASDADGNTGNNNGSEKFCFRNGSVGNFFFAGARTFFRSLDAAIFLYSRVSGIPQESYVLPVIQSDDRLLLGAELSSGTLIRGQNEISHPPSTGTTMGGDDDDMMSPRGGRMSVNKGAGWSRLPSPIRRVLYLSTEGGSQHEVFPQVNPSVLQRLSESDCIVFGMGSLYTSICPALILPGIGEAVAARRNVPKVLILNGSEDRETAGMSAVDIVLAVQSSLNRSWGEYGDEEAHANGAGADDNATKGGVAASGGWATSPPALRLREREIESLEHGVDEYITAVLYPLGCGHEIDEDALKRVGIDNVVPVASRRTDDDEVIYERDALVATIRDIVTSSFTVHR